MRVNPTFVFSADELDPGRVDEPFRAHAAALRDAGFRIWLFDGRKLITRGDPLEGAIVIFRGWMMKPNEYEDFALLVKSAGAEVFIPAHEYRASHYIDGWINEISDLTPETVLAPPDADVAQIFQTLTWGRFFLKDFVKSLKTSRGSIAESLDEAIEVVEQMKKFRGEIEGGFAIRRVEQFDTASERRYFILNGRAWGPDENAPIPEIVDEVAKRLSGRRFVSVDVIQRNDGVLRVVEVGDGQVSDLVGWQPDRFATMFRSTFL